jgi:hypothetical protein
LTSSLQRTTAFNGSNVSLIETQLDATSVRLMRRAYYASISFMDAQLGRVLDALRDTGLAGNTIVTFIGDHGYSNGQKGEWCKSSLFELATRIPMFVVVPDTVAPRAVAARWARGAVVATVVESIDLYLTLADLAGLALPREAFGGESLRALLVEKSAATNVSATAAVRTKTWALSQVRCSFLLFALLCCCYSFVCSSILLFVTSTAALPRSGPADRRASRRTAAGTGPAIRTNRRTTRR